MKCRKFVTSNMAFIYILLTFHKKNADDISSSTISRLIMPNTSQNYFTK